MRAQVCAPTIAAPTQSISGVGDRKIATATGGILDVDLDVVATTASLSFKTNTKGDGLTSINWITGAGTLKKLDASGVDLLGGIQMDGVIQSMQLHNIESDIVMGASQKLEDLIREADKTFAADAAASVVRGNVRFQVLSPSLVRMEYSPKSSFVDEASVAVVGRSDFSGVAAKTSEKDGWLTLWKPDSSRRSRRRARTS